MINEIKSIFTVPTQRKRFIRFGIVGLSGVLINNGLLWLLAENSGFPFYLCSLIAIEISIITNFLFNDNWTWVDKRKGNLLTRFLRYNTSTAFSSIFINIFILLFLKEWIGLAYIPANLIGIGCGMISNYILNSIWTYGNKRIILPLQVKLILLTSLIFRILIATGIGAGYDEAYYFGYSLRPALSYFDHPPFVGFLAGFVPYLTGIISPFTIRLGAVCLFTAAGLIFFHLAKQRLSQKEAVIAYGLMNITPIFFLGAGTMILPDAGLLFFWITALAVFMKILQDDNERLLLWIAAGILTGLALLSKYLGVFLGFSLVIYLLLKNPRKFLRPYPYIYGFAAFLVFLPVIIWNYHHSFISFTFQGARAVSSSISINGLFQALGGQAGYLTPLIFLPMIYIIWVTFKKGVIEKNHEYFFYFIFGSLPVIIVNLISLFRPILPHWTMPGYILLCLPLARLIKKKISDSKFIRIFVPAYSLFIVLLLLTAFLHTRYGIFHLEKLAQKGLITQKEFYKDATLDQQGWQVVNDYLKLNEIDPAEVFLFTHKWFLSGEVELAAKGKFKVLCFNKKDSRGYGIWDRKYDMIGKDAVCIYTNRYKIDPIERFGAYFESISSPDSITVFRGGVPSKRFYFSSCRNLKKRFPLPYSFEK